MKLEPRVYDVLAFLIAHRDRVVTLREMHETLWPGEFVTDSAVTRCISEARRAVGDTGDEQRVIRTLHGRGYRFVADMTGDTVERAPAAPAADPAPTTAGNVGVLRSDPVSNPLSGVPGLVVRSPDYGAIGRGAPDVTPPAGATHLLEAAISRSADRLKGHLVVTLREAAADASSLSTPLGIYDLPFLGPGTDLTTFTRVRDAIVSRLVGVLLPAIDLPGGDSVRPRDPRAFRLYLLAASRIAQTVICDQAALELVKQSLELDPTYAPSWVLLGWAHDNQATTCAQNGSHYEEALSAAARAIELSPGLPTAYPLRSAVLVETGRVEEAFAQLRDVAPRFPGAPDVQYALVYALTYAGFLDEARRHLDRVLALDPSYLTAGGWTPNVAMYERSWDRFLALLPAIDTPLFRFYRGYALLQQGNRADARRELSPSFRLNPHDVFARLSLALTALIDGQRMEAVSLVRQLARQRAELGSGDGEVTYKQAQLLVLADQQDEGLSELARAVDQGFFCARCFERDPVLATVHHDNRFRRTFTAAERRRAAFGARFSLP